MPSAEPVFSNKNRVFTQHRCRGLTLVEVIVSMIILALLTVGTLSILMQSRLMTEGSIYQNAALTVTQGYLEQIKNMNLDDIPYYTSGGTLTPGNGKTIEASTLTSLGITNSDPVIFTQLNNTTYDPLTISAGEPPELSTITPGSAPPNGVVDNIKSIPILINQDKTTNTHKNLTVKIWIWVKDLTNTSTDATRVRSVTMIYHWRTAEAGGKGRWHISAARGIITSL